mmetsp:Transcript_54561/g.132479  ORF Transcript_54561/g.132479 Transcript_54561/m.132479 type:complete len:105 (+) Transcript_54561:642-956(+)
MMGGMWIRLFALMTGACSEKNSVDMSPDDKSLLHEPTTFDASNTQTIYFCAVVFLVLVLLLSLLQPLAMELDVVFNECRNKVVTVIETFSHVDGDSLSDLLGSI